MPRPSAASTSRDPLYESVTAAARYQGMEHWLPFFHDRLETLFDYLDDPVVTLDHTADEAAAARLEQIDEFYQARREALDKKESFGAAPYKPIRPEIALSDSRRMDAGARPTIARWRFRPSRAPMLICRSWAASAAGASRRSGPWQDGNLYEAVRTHTETSAAGRQARGHRQLDRRIARAPADDPQGP